MATTQRDGKAYIWVTWITGLLAGDKECGFSPWFKAHFRYEKLSDRNMDLAAWNADHTALVQRRRAELEFAGYQVTLEGKNAFRFTGHTAILAGKPDLVARKYADGNLVDVLVSDGKTGKPRRSDWWQVLIYLLALPRCMPEFEGVRVRGEVCYRTETVSVEPEELNAERRNDIFTLLKQIGASAPLEKQPSDHDCGFCDIGPNDCPERFVREAAAEPITLAAEF